VLPRATVNSFGARLLPEDARHLRSLGELVDQLVEERIFCISGSATSSTRAPHTTPVMSPAFGFSRGAWAKNVSRSTSASMAR
jgi:hypothetical protein